MKFYRFRKNFYSDVIALLPTITLAFDDPIYCCRNFAISVRFLWFHLNWLWLEEGR